MTNPANEAAFAGGATHSTGHDHGVSHDDHGHDHPQLSFIEKYIFSQDHKVIGIQ